MGRENVCIVIKYYPNSCMKRNIFGTTDLTFVSYRGFLLGHIWEDGIR